MSSTPLSGSAGAVRRSKSRGSSNNNSKAYTSSVAADEKDEEIRKLEKKVKKMKAELKELRAQLAQQQNGNGETNGDSADE
jgi:predicted RNase H-like nuclease (RuvC/YqgF family)